MSDMLRTIAAYVPPRLVRTVLNSPAPAKPTEPHVNRLTAAVLYADVSGFTPLTEALALKGAEGPEELTRLLNRYFGWMIAFIEAEGGEVVKFGGDSLTVVFPALEESLSIVTRRAMQAATTMQTAMDEFGVMESSVGLVSLRVKLGIGAGELFEAQAGGIFSRWEYIIAGDALFQATVAERSAKTGEIVLSENARQVIHPDSLSPRPLPPIDWANLRDPAAIERALRCFVPGPVLIWPEKDMHGWLGTLRPMSVLFVGVEGLDYSKPDTLYHLHQFARNAQKIIYRYEGSLTRLTVDDKGTVFLILFGAPPFSHEDDAERSLRCALDLQKEAQQQGFRLSVGATSGRVFAGPVGGLTRREYTVMGDTVNLAARLMSAGEIGQVSCNYEAYRGTYGQLDFEPLPPVKVKGKSEPIRVYLPKGKYHPDKQLQNLQQEEDKMIFVGRQLEMKRLEQHVAALTTGQGSVVIIEGEAGIGKSQLVHKMIISAQEKGIKTLMGMGRSVDQLVQFKAWKDVFYAYFKAYNQDFDRQRDIDTLKHVAQNVPTLTKFLPLLKDIFDLEVAETSLTASFTVEQRQKTLAWMLLRLLAASTKNEPFAVILEDAQWLDRLSWELAVQMAQAIQNQGLPILLVIVFRPLEDSQTRHEVNKLAIKEQVDAFRLETLLAEETLTLVAGSLGLTGNELPDVVAELLRNRAGGNPFFAEEIFHYLHQNGYITLKTLEDKPRCLVSGDFNRAAQTLPATIQSVILSRLDKLPAEKQLLLKIAAIIGQVFAYPTVRDTMREYVEVTEEELHNLLDELSYLGMIKLESDDPILTYAFKHVIFREVVYQSLLFDRRRQLHRTVARWYEETYTPDTSERLAALQSGSRDTSAVTGSLPPAITPLAPYYSLLVYHWHQADDPDKERLYATLLGDQAVAQYAHAEALAYLTRALKLTPADNPDNVYDRFKLLLAREVVYDRQGDRERQAADLKTLTDMANTTDEPYWKAVVYMRTAAYAASVGKYTRSLALSEATIPFAKQANNIAIECQAYRVWAKVMWKRGAYARAEKTISRAQRLAAQNQLYHVEAEILTQHAQLCLAQGQYRKARDNAGRSLGMAKTYNDRLLQADNLNVLGKTYRLTGQFGEALQQFEQVVPILHAAGVTHKQFVPMRQIGMLRFYDGDYEAARDYFEQALDIAKDTGDEAGVADSLTWIGKFYYTLGDYLTAQSYIGQALGIQKDLGHRPGEADSLNHFARIYFGMGDNRIARRYCDMALEILQTAKTPEIARYTYTCLGHALSAMNKLDTAANAYQRVIDMCQETESHIFAVTAMAGLAAVRLAQHHPESASELADNALALLENAPMTGVEDILWSYLRIYHTLQTLGKDEAAQNVLNTAYSTVQQFACHFKERELKRKFLCDEKTNREIISLWEGNGQSASRQTGDQAQSGERDFD